MANWTPVSQRAEISVFTDHLSDPDAVVARLLPFDVVCVMRERTPLPRSVLQKLPRLKMIASTGPGNASIDENAAREYNIRVTNTGYRSTPTIELTWALILASTRGIVDEATSVRGGGWQLSVGHELRGKTLGIVGLGRIGSEVARIGKAFGMNTIAWSQNLTLARAMEVGVTWVGKQDLFRGSDIVSIHLALSERTRGVVGPDEFAAMKPSARLINTSRGPIVDEDALIAALTSGMIASAALDVYDREPLPAEHPLRTLPNVLATPHIGYVTDDLDRTFYGDAAASIASWLDEQEPHANR
jgi:phosphoglycerate dehydrogenase-like enzyme